MQTEIRIRYQKKRSKSHKIFKKTKIQMIQLEHIQSQPCKGVHIFKKSDLEVGISIDPEVTTFGNTFIKVEDRKLDREETLNVKQKDTETEKSAQIAGIAQIAQIAAEIVVYGLVPSNQFNSEKFKMKVKLSFIFIKLNPNYLLSQVIILRLEQK